MTVFAAVSKSKTSSQAVSKSKAPANGSAKPKWPAMKRAAMKQSPSVPQRIAKGKTQAAVGKKQAAMGFRESKAAKSSKAVGGAASSSVPSHKKPVQKT